MLSTVPITDGVNWLKLNALKLATLEFTVTFTRVKLMVPSAAVTLMTKKSPVVICAVDPLVKELALSKVLTEVPEANFTILLIVAEEFVSTKVVAVSLVAWAEVRVSVPGVSLPSVALGVPNVGACPLITEVFERVAMLEFTVTFTRVYLTEPSPAVTWIKKKSPVVICAVEPFEKAVSVSKSLT